MLQESKSILDEICAHVFLTPDIRFDGEGVVCEALWCGPLDGELGPSVGSVGVTSHQPAQTKVCNLYDMVLPNQAVPRCEIPEKGKDKARREGNRKSVCKGWGKSEN